MVSQSRKARKHTKRIRAKKIFTASNVVTLRTVTRIILSSSPHTHDNYNASHELTSCTVRDGCALTPAYPRIYPLPLKPYVPTVVVPPRFPVGTTPPLSLQHPITLHTRHFPRPISTTAPHLPRLRKILTQRHTSINTCISKIGLQLKILKQNYLTRVRSPAM